MSSYNLFFSTQLGSRNFVVSSVNYVTVLHLKNNLETKLYDGSNQYMSLRRIQDKITYRSSRLSSREKTLGVTFLIKFPVNFLKDCNNER